MPASHDSVPHGDGTFVPLLGGGRNGVWTCQLVSNDCVGKSQVAVGVGGGVWFLVVKDWA